MNNLLRSSRCMLRLVSAHSCQPHAQITDAKIGRSVGPEVSALLLHCRNISTSPVVADIIQRPGWKGFATAEVPEGEAAEISPLLQTPAPASKPTAGKQRPVPRTPTRDRDPATAKAVLRDIPISAKKLAMWTDVVRRKHISDAIVQCDMAHKKAAKICLKVLRSAQANAVNNHGLDGSKLRVDLVHVGTGTPKKMVWPHGRGRSGIRRKYKSHLTVVLREGEWPVYARFQRPMMEKHFLQAA